MLSTNHRSARVTGSERAGCEPGCSRVGLLLVLAAAVATAILPRVGFSQEGNFSYTPFYRMLAQETQEAFESGSFAGMQERFAASFLQQVPLTRMNQIPSSYQPVYGEVIGVEFVVQRDDPAFGPGTLFFHAQIRGNRRALIRMRLDREQKIVAWHLGPSTEILDSTADIRRALLDLPGKVSVFARARGAPQPFFSLNPDMTLAIGSAFKLYVLAEVLRQSESGGMRLGQVIQLRSQNLSLPSGKLQKWPRDAPVTVQTLATLMISESDNTASDHLIDVIGRQELERRLGRHYLNSLPERNTPFLKTRELFLLQAEGSPYAELRERYLVGDVTEKRKILRELRDMSLEGMPQITLTGGLFDHLEWFASTRNLADLMDFLFSGELLRKPETMATMRGILAIHPGIGNDEGDPRIRYLGYKGGSEPGVLNLTQWIETTSDQQLVLTMTWNNKEGAVEQEKLVSLFKSLRQAFVNSVDSTHEAVQDVR